MTRREHPGVLVVANDCPNSGRIAAMLEEAGIIVTTAPDGAAALAAAARRRYDLAIVASPPQGADLVAALRARQPGLELLVLDETDAFGPVEGFEPRRFVGRVRERLLCGRNLLADPERDESAEACIAAAKLACLHRRREMARNAGARRLAAELRREIDETATHRQALLWQAAGLAPAHHAAVDRRVIHL